jgi:acetyl esterase/lipase
LLKEKTPEPDRRISYGTNELQFGELRLPKRTGLHPVVVLLHGGCWKAQLAGLDPRATSLDLLRPIAVALIDAGFATWNVEYRRVGNDGGGWPGTFHDVGEATDFLRTFSERHSLDLKRVIVAGHSAGGHLAFWVGARPNLPASNPLYRKDPLKVKAVMNLDGPIDLKAAAPFTERFCGFRAITEFMGGSPEELAPQYAAASASSFLPLGVRQEIVAGSLIAGIREQITEYAQQAKSKGDVVTLTSLENAGHFGFLSPKSEAWKIVKERLLAIIAD